MKLSNRKQKELIFWLREQKEWNCSLHADVPFWYQAYFLWIFLTIAHMWKLFLDKVRKLSGCIAMYSIGKMDHTSIRATELILVSTLAMNFSLRHTETIRNHLFFFYSHQYGAHQLSMCMLSLFEMPEE